MGGEKALLNLVNEAHKLGVKVMAMYGINIVNNTLTDFNKWGKPSLLKSTSGAIFDYGSVDWDSSRHYDHHSNSQCNIGSKRYRDYLFKQIKEASLKYDFDGAFLDIAAYYNNSPDYSVFKGVKKLCQDLLEIKPNFLISGEGCYDGLISCMPLFQSGHTEGVMHYHDFPYDKLFTPYAREFAHLCLGDFTTHSTGVHELGFNPITKVPLRKGIIPTISLLNETVLKNIEDIKEVIKDSLEYLKLQ
jgi:hypothetical protein